MRACCGRPPAHTLTPTPAAQGVVGFADAVFQEGIKWPPPTGPTPVSLPGKSHGPRSLVGCSPWGRRVGHHRATDRAPSAWYPSEKRVGLRHAGGQGCTAPPRVGTRGGHGRPHTGRGLGRNQPDRQLHLGFPASRTFRTEIPTLNVTQSAVLCYPSRPTYPLNNHPQPTPGPENVVRYRCGQSITFKSKVLSTRLFPLCAYVTNRYPIRLISK